VEASVSCNATPEPEEKVATTLQKKSRVQKEWILMKPASYVVEAGSIEERRHATYIISFFN